MKKSSLLHALLFLAGMIVGGVAVFFFVKPHEDASIHVSEPTISQAPPGTPGDGDTGLEEADEIPPQGEQPAPSSDEASIPPPSE